MTVGGECLKVPWCAGDATMELFTVGFCISRYKTYHLECGRSGR